LRCHALRVQEIHMPKKNTWCIHVVPTKESPNLRPFIFIGEGEPEETGALYDRFEEHYYIHDVMPGHALLVDLRGKEPRFESVPIGYKLPEDPR
jgi:hypothetical protein